MHSVTGCLLFYDFTCFQVVSLSLYVCQSLETDVISLENTCHFLVGRQQSPLVSFSMAYSPVQSSHRCGAG